MPNTKALGVAFEDPILNGAVINNSAIGATTPAAGTFTTLTATGDAALGNAETDTISFYGVAGSTQRASASQAALTLVTSLNTNGFGFTTTTAFTAFISQLEEIRATLVAVGLMKGSA